MTLEITGRRRSGPLARIGLWVLKVLLASAFLIPAYLKLSGQPKMVEEFASLGFGQGFRYVTGAIEGAGGLLLLWPRSAFLGALILLGICGGALIAQVLVLHRDLIHVFVLSGLLALVAWVSRPAALRRG